MLVGLQAWGAAGSYRLHGADCMGAARTDMFVSLSCSSRSAWLRTMCVQSRLQTRLLKHSDQHTL